MSEPIRWGIAATGGVARRFVADAALAADTQVVAVASRTRESAERFGDEHGIARRHGSYVGLAADPDVDIVYVASPNHRHRSDTELFLEAGKHVLCEKPFAMNRMEAEEMVATASRHQRFLMEAMWSRFLPSWTAMRDLIERGDIGEVRIVTADFGFRADVDPVARHFDPGLGGGALLDLGVYPITLATWLLGGPRSIQASGHVGVTGVDEQVGIMMSHAGGALSLLHAAIRTVTPATARVSGTDGAIVVPPFFHAAQGFEVHRGSHVEVVDAPTRGSGLCYQIEAVNQAVRDGHAECAGMPLADSVRTMGILDEVRSQLGVRFPDELGGSPGR